LSPFKFGGWVLFALCLGAFAVGCKAPERPTTAIDTTFLRDYAETWGYSAGQPTGIQVTPKGDAVLFLRSGPRDLIRNLYEFKTVTGEVRGLLRAEDLLGGSAGNLTAEEKARRERIREIGKGFTWFNLSEDGEDILVGLSGRLFVVHRSDGRRTPFRESPAGPAMDARFSPDGKYVSCIRGYDLYVIDRATKQERALTTGGTQDLSHGVAEFVAQEELDRRTGYWWSADSQWLAYEESDQQEVEKLYIADARNPAAAPQGWRYPRAGKTNAKVRLGIISVTGGTTRWIDWDRERYPYLSTVQWGMDAPLTIYVQTRDQREGVLYRVDHLTGKMTELLRDRDSAWLNLDSDMPRWLAGEKEFLWTTEQSGQWEVERRGRDGALQRTYKLPEANLYGVIAVDQGRREFVVQGGADPTQSQLYRVSLDGGEVAVLTQDRGSHSGTFSKDGSIWVESASLPDGCVRQTVRGRDMIVRGELPSVAETPPFSPTVELTTVKAEGRTFHAAVIRPRTFDKHRKYPVIVSVYGGPHVTVVTSAARSYLRQQWIADQGFI
jgi:dipeptidyl-peptidase-4